ncbi:MAG: hypothetical protein ABGX83_05540 [Nitrospira sp.]
MPTFDGTNQLIILDAGVTTVDVEQDLYSAWKAWFKTPGNAKFPLAFRGSVAGDPLSLVLDIGGYFFLQNQLGWRIRPAEENATITFTGNLIAQNQALPIFVPTLGAFTVFVNGLQPITQNIDAVVAEQLRLSTGLKYLGETGNRQSHAAFGDFFFWDPVNGSNVKDGKTPAKAVKDFVDALALTVADNHDVIFAIPGGSGTTTYVTPINLNKPHTFLRGPGPNFLLQSPSITVPNVLLSAEGASIEGFAINQTGAGQPAVKAAHRNLLLKDLSIRDSAGDGMEVDETGVTVANSTNIYEDLDIVGSAGHAIHIRNKARHAFYQGKIHLMASGGDAVRMGGDVISQHFVEPITHKNTGYAFNLLDSAVVDTLIKMPTYGNDTAGRLKDLGTRTMERGRLLSHLPESAVAIDGGNTASTFKTDLTETATDYWKDVLIKFTSGALKDQVKKISLYNGTTKFITVSEPFTAAPLSGSEFKLVNE